jgi:hypothetical protein
VQFGNFSLKPWALLCMLLEKLPKETKCPEGRKFFLSGVDVNDHNFLRFLPIFGEKKLVFFSKTNVMIKFLQKLAVV